jgi:hypothetical protein
MIVLVVALCPALIAIAVIAARATVSPPIAERASRAASDIASRR